MGMLRAIAIVPLLIPGMLAGCGSPPLESERPPAPPPAPDGVLTLPPVNGGPDTLTPPPAIAQAPLVLPPSDPWEAGPHCFVYDDGKTLVQVELLLRPDLTLTGQLQTHGPTTSDRHTFAGILTGTNLDISLGNRQEQWQTLASGLRRQNTLLLPIHCEALISETAKVSREKLAQYQRFPTVLALPLAPGERWEVGTAIAPQSSHQYQIQPPPQSQKIHLTFQGDTPQIRYQLIDGPAQKEKNHPQPAPPAIALKVSPGQPLQLLIQNPGPLGHYQLTLSSSP